MDYPTNPHGSDWGGECVRLVICWRIRGSVGIKQEPEAPAAHQQVGISEHIERTIIEVMRYLLGAVGLHAFTWGTIVVRVLLLSTG